VRRAAWIWTLVCLVALTLLTGSIGLGWGLPSRERSAFYPMQESFEGEQGSRRYDTKPSDSLHPDEAAILNALGQMDPPSGDLNPRYFSYPTLWIYATGLVVGAASAVDVAVILSSEEAYDADPVAARRVFLVGRALTVLAAVATVLATAVVGARMFDRRTGAAAGFVLALTPVWVRDLHFLLPNVPATGFMVLCAGLAHTSVQRTSVRLLYLSAAAGGMAASTKYPAGAILAVTAVAGVRIGVSRRTGLVAFGIAVLAFFIGTPYSLLVPAEFLGDLDRERGLRLGLPAVWELVGTFASGLGFVLLALGVISVARLIRTNPDVTRQLLLVWLSVAASGPLLADEQAVRYLLPLLPPLAICVSATLVSVGRAWSERVGHRGVLRRLVPGLPMLILLPTAWYSFDVIAALRAEPSQVEAARWVEDNLPQESRVGVFGGMYYDAPPVDAERYALTDLEVDRSGVVPDLVVVSHLEQGRFEDWLGEQERSICGDGPLVFGSSPPTWPTPGLSERVPSDWLFTYPEVSLYPATSIC